MTLAVFLTLAVAQQLQVVPFPSDVGVVAEVRVRQNGQPVAGAEVVAERPDGAIVVVGSTDAAGNLSFVPSAAGDYAIAATIAGVRTVVPHRVVERRNRWPLAIGCIPLGLAALWRLSRELGRRGS